MIDLKTVIHKRMHDMRRCQSFKWQACKAIQNNSDSIDQMWQVPTSFFWKDVTCDICKSFKGVSMDWNRFWKKK